MVSSASCAGLPQAVGKDSQLARVIPSTETQEARELVVLGVLVIASAVHL